MTLLKKILPFLFCVFLIFFEKMPFSFSADNQVNVPFIFIAVFYFSLYLPDSFNVIPVFSLGLLADFLAPSFFGFQTFFLVLLYFVISLMRSLLLKWHFETLWFAFAFLMVCMDILFSFVLILFSPYPIDISYFVVQYILLILFFPLITMCCRFLIEKVR